MIGGTLSCFFTPTNCNFHSLHRSSIANKKYSAWQVNTELKPLDMDELKEVVANRTPGDKKFNKDLWGAYEVAAEEHDLEYFKGMLVEHEKNIIQLREEESAKEQKKAEAAEKKAKRKSAGTAAADAEGDVTMEDAASEDAPKKPKKTPKRKADKEAEVDEEDKVTTCDIGVHFNG